MSISPNKPSAEKLAELLARARAARNLSIESESESESNVTAKPTSSSGPDTESIINLNTLTNNTNLTGIDRTGHVIQYNEEQLRFMQLAGTGESAILIGAAGTGKTTCMRGAITTLVQNGRAGLMSGDGHKYLPTGGVPGIVAVSFTRRAVSNLRRAMPDDMKKNCLTIHALLEYEPVYYDVIDPITGDSRNTMRFEPTRNGVRPLSSTIRTCVIDESSMVSCELFQELRDALPTDCQFIFLGDIQQLPPVFGSAILGYKMLELQTVELTQVYRQALESPIIRLAHRILSGTAIESSEYPEWKYPKQLTIHPWKKKLTAEMALITIAKFLTTAIEAGAYDPAEDMILIPFNKACGTIELNKHIAQFMARKNGREVFEIIAGFNKLYLAAGDRILYDKEDATVISIKSNETYSGASPVPSSTTLDYWGYDSGSSESIEHGLDSDGNSNGDDIDFLLSQSVAAGADDEDRVRQASHLVEIEIIETGQKLTLNTAAALNALLLSYALTVHKSQGSEWRKVFLMLHQSHNTMLQREMLYTAVTRAKEELYVICEPESFKKGISSQRIKGNTLAEKAEYFKGKVATGRNGGIL